MGEFRVWLGSPSSFQQECSKLIDLLENLDGRCLALENSSSSGFQWILDSPLIEVDVDEEGTITLFTSGTTGKPKAIKKRWKEILSNKRGSGIGADRWLLTYSPTRWAGISVIAHCIKNKSELVIPRTLDISDIVEALDRCTHISLTPSMFKKININFDLSAYKNIKQVTFGGELSTQSVLDKARELWPLARITHIYASTEFGDLMCSHDGKEGFSKVPGQVLDSGELVINGVPTGDIWKLENGRYHFVGRQTDIINVGGAKVNVLEVEKILSGVDGVLECRVYGVSSPLLGQLVCADYVGEKSPKEVAILLRQKLPKFAVPQLNKVENIQLSENGKIRRI